MVLSGGCRDHLSMQLCMQKVLAMAVRTVMMKLMMVLMFSFFIVVMGLMVTQSCGGFDGYTILWWDDGYTIGGEGLWRL